MLLYTVLSDKKDFLTLTFLQVIFLSNLLSAFIADD